MGNPIDANPSRQHAWVISFYNYSVKIGIEYMYKLRSQVYVDAGENGES